MKRLVLLITLTFFIILPALNQLSAKITVGQPQNKTGKVTESLRIQLCSDARNGVLEDMLNTCRSENVKLEEVYADVFDSDGKSLAAAALANDKFDDVKNLIDFLKSKLGKIWYDAGFVIINQPDKTGKSLLQQTKEAMDKCDSGWRRNKLNDLYNYLRKKL